MFVRKMFLPWIEENAQVVVHLSRIDVWNKQIHEKYHMCIGRAYAKNILSSVNFQDLVMLY